MSLQEPRIRASDGIRFWIEEGLKRKGRTFADLARKLKIQDSQVSRLRKGERLIKASEVTIISDFIGVQPPEELHEFLGRFDVAKDAGDGEMKEVEPRSVRRVPVVAEAVSGVWYEPHVIGNGESQPDRYPPIPVVIDRRFSRLQQLAVKQVDDSMSLEIPAGMFAIYVDYWKVRDTPRADDYVLVERMDSGKIEFTLRKLVIEKGILALACTSAYKPWLTSRSALSEDLKTELSNPSVRVNLKGLVIWLGRPLI